MTDLTNDTDEVSNGGSEFNDRLELLPCPFCNKAAELWVTGAGYKVACGNMLCGIQPSTHVGGLFLDGAIRNWNQRPNN